MSCDECSYLGVRCDVCTEIHISDIRRRSTASGKWRKAFTNKSNKCPRCTCCTAIDIALFYRNCPEDAYVAHKLQYNQGGYHCTKNLKYFVKVRLTSK